MNILFIGCGFYNYDSYICEELKKSCSVTYISESHYRKKFPYLTYFIWNRLKQRKLIEWIEGLYIEKIIRRTKDIDTVFLIYGPNSSLTEKHICQIEKLHPSAAFVLYLWDAWYRIDKKDMLLTHFKNIYSFDTEDCMKYGFKHRPLFYSTPPVIGKAPKIYDISNVGVGHSNRLESLSKIKKICIDNGIKYYFHLVIGTRIYYVWKYFKKNQCSFYMDIIAKDALPYSEYLRVVDSSKAIIDFPHPTQCGLTMRTIEALSRGVKVVTSNKYIRNHKDIPESMYLVLDESFTAKKLVDFLSRSDSSSLPERYSLPAFLAEVLGI